MSIPIPADASAAVQQAFRDVNTHLARLATSNPSQSTDLNGRRVTNAGTSKAPGDYVTRAELDAVIGRPAAPQTGGVLVATTGAPTANNSPDGSTVNTLTVNQLLRVLGLVTVPRLTDGSGHHVIVFVDASGSLSGVNDGAGCFAYNDLTLRLELGYGMTIEWLSQAGIASPAVGVLKVVAADGATAAEIDAAAFGVLDGTTILKSLVAQTDYSAAGAGTLTNAPAAGNPTKWMRVNDNGTMRYLPLW